MRTPATYVICITVLILGWFIAEVGWTLAKNPRRPFEAYRLPDITSRRSYERRGIPTSTCTECIDDEHKLRSLVQFKTIDDSRVDIVAIETLHEVFIVIASVVVATSWVTVLTLVLNSRIQRRLDQRLLAMFAHRDPFEEFRSQRRYG